MYHANWPAKAQWSVNDIPDLSGKVIIVTGASLALLHRSSEETLVPGGNTGIGKETVKALLAKNAKVYIASHNQARVDAAVGELEKETGNKALFIELNLASLSSVKDAAETFQKLESKLDVLINNACVLAPRGVWSAL
jgi:NAD(P)-dependent dehydrogenase (short-subunit alcohol dehydrogenase family)